MTQPHHVVAGFLKHDDKFLLCHRSATRSWYPLVWDLPGGHVSVEETPATALTRELQEELGIDVGPLPTEPTFSGATDEAAVSLWHIT
jgi:8-oxo-dGTP diphosphatase